MNECRPIRRGKRHNRRKRLPTAAPRQAYAYDKLGNVLSVTHLPTDGLRDVIYELDFLGRRVAETSAGVRHRTVYDVAGNMLNVTYGENTPAPRTLDSGYDAHERLESLTENGRVSSYQYDRNGNTRLRILPNAEQIAQSYDAQNRRTLIGTATYEFEQTYDLAGNLRRIEESYPANPALDRTVVNTYDGANRLKEEAVSAATAVTTVYGYDDANNRTSRVVTGGSGAGTTSYQHNGLNQLEQFTDPTKTVTFAYSLAGNRVGRTEGSTTDVYEYDYENRLLELDKLITGADIQTGTFQYAYDYRTRRVERDESAAGGAVTALAFSGGTSVREIENASVTVEYVRGSDYGGGVGGILYTLRGGSPAYTHYNSRGDVVAKTDAAGSLTFQATYEAFGKRTGEVGSTPDRQKANTKEEDPTGLLNEGFRYRDLETGTFITRDPAGFVDGPNLYTYVNQNPWTKFDPEGLQAYELGANLRARDEQLAELGIEPPQQARSAGRELAGTVANTADFAVSMTPAGGLNEALGGKNAKGEDIGASGRVLAAGGVVVGPAFKAASKLLRGAKNLLGIGAKSAFEIASEGGRHAGQLRVLSTQTDKQLRKSTGSFEKNIAEHQGWIADPTSKVPEAKWKAMSKREQKGLINKWKGDIQRNTEHLDIAKGVEKTRQKAEEAKKAKD